MAARHSSYQRKSDQPTAITPIEYSGLQQAYDHFKDALFDGELPDVFITYQRKSHSTGYFAADRFSGRIGKFGKHELALNPDGFIDKTDEQIVQTLVHEMVHVWQHAFGTPPGRGYHNKEWAAKMKGIGLQPSSTGMVGGKETGQRMADYIIPGGAFTKAYAKLAAAGWKLNLQSAARPGQQGGANSKTKFTCSSCKQNAWGKPDLEIDCHLCGGQMRAADPIAAEPVVAPPQSYDAKPEHFAAHTARAEQLGHVLEGSWRGLDGGTTTTAFENSCERCGETFDLFWDDDGKPICVIEPCSELLKRSMDALAASALPAAPEPERLAKRKPGRPKGSKNKPKASRRKRKRRSVQMTPEQNRAA